jgi:homeobox-leucine zipper protein
MSGISETLMTPPNLCHLQGFAYLPGGVCVSSMGRPVSYEQAVAWKVLSDDDTPHCLAFTFVNWSFV